MQPNQIETLIQTGLTPCKVFVEGDGTHFNAIVISPDFAGKTRIQRQQCVYETVKQQLLDGTLHALSIQTFTPEEWENIPTDDVK